MTCSPASLAARLKYLESKAAAPQRYVVALSGGLDSSALLHMLCACVDKAQILALHVNHGLQDEAREWAAHCAAMAKSLGVQFRRLDVEVDLNSGRGLEAAARVARYRAMHELMGDGDWLLSGHHREDQAETVILNLLRGSGPAGVAGIGEIQKSGPGWLVRPLLDIGQNELRDYAQAVSLQWIDDPSNTDVRFDRNYLRHKVMPVLQQRWPDIAQRLHRSATHAGEAEILMRELAAADLRGIGGDARRLPLDGLQALDASRQRNLIRFALRESGLTTPSTQMLQRVLDEVIPAREDAQPLVIWDGAAVRRYRNNVYLMQDKIADAIVPMEVAGEQVRLGVGLGSLHFEQMNGPGLSAELVARGLRIAPREGGEEIRLNSQSPTRKLKKLLQEEGVVPWMRDRLPLVYSGGDLLAVGDLWMAADAITAPGIRVRWSGRPALH